MSAPAEWCDGCTFYEVILDPIADMAGTGMTRGFCRRFPPKPKKHEDGGRVRLSVFPVVHNRGWCGEWLERGTL